MGFQEEHESLLMRAIKPLKGEAKRRLLKGHGFSEKMFLEKVWWPAVGHFRQLHPEYEVSDFRDGARYLDFAYFAPLTE